MRVDLVPGASFDVVSPDEMKVYMTSFERHVDDAVRGSLQGIKPMQFQPLKMVTAAGNFSGILGGPNEGYYWLVKRISLWGIAAADVNSTTVNLFYGDSINATRFVDQLIPNKAWVGSADQLIVRSGDTLFISGSGAATSSLICASGSAIEVPSEMIGKIL